MRWNLHSPILRRRGCEAGSAAVEFAVVVLPVILVALGTFDYFAASYEVTTLAGAARAVAELARNDANCAGDVTRSSCTTDIASLISAMGTSNNSLSSITCCTSSATTSGVVAPIYYYSCAGSQNVLSTTSPSCTTYTDTRIIQYVQVTIKKAWSKFLSWDPWSSSNPLTTRVTVRTQ